MKLQLILILLLILPTIMAYQVNTTVTIDFTGSDIYYLRTESGDLGPYNISDQTDRYYLINMTRLSATNQSDMEYISSMVANLSKSCSNITLFSQPYYRELEVNWSNCAGDRSELFKQVDRVNSEKLNLTTSLGGLNNQLASLQASCTNQMNGLQSSYNTCTITLNNQTSIIQDLTKGKSSNLMLGLVIGAGIIGGLWYQTSQKTKINGPSEMRRFGYGGQPK
jgi:hypothetical protein